MKVNGHSVSIGTVGVIIVNLVGWGITIGTILNELKNQDRRLNAIEQTDREQWRAIRAAEAGERKP